jgi:iron-sulfur cluster insertion protein
MLFSFEKGKDMAITITEKAAREVQRILGARGGESPEKLHLRLRVVGGGCSGFQHKLDLDAKVNDKLDQTFEMHGIPVVVDKRSMVYLENVTLDYHDDMNRRGFSFENPNATSTCGCGSSFSM